jgi:methionyl-tRNA synthetase
MMVLDIMSLMTQLLNLQKNKMKEQIEFSEFLEIEKKLEIRIGKVESVEDVPKSDKLIKLMVNFGPKKDHLVPVVTNIKPQLSNPQLLVNMSFAFVTNLKPVKMMGIESEAMILPGELDTSYSILTVNGQLGEKLL